MSGFNTLNFAKDAEDKENVPSKFRETKSTDKSMDRSDGMVSEIAEKATLSDLKDFDEVKDIGDTFDEENVSVRFPKFDYVQEDVGDADSGKDQNQESFIKPVEEMDSSVMYINKDLPSCQKLLFVLNELDLDCVLIELRAHENFMPKFMELNPAGDLPFMQCGGKVIVGLNAILEFIEKEYISGVLFPLVPIEGTAERDDYENVLKALDSIAFDEVLYGTLMNPALMRKPKMTATEQEICIGNLKKTHQTLGELMDDYPEYFEVYLVMQAKLAKILLAANDIETVKKHVVKVDGVLEMIDKQLSCHENSDDWLCGPNFTFADISLAVLLRQLDYIGLSSSLFKKLHIRSFYERVQERDSFKKVFQVELLPESTSCGSSYGVLVIAFAIIIIFVVVFGVCTYLKYH